MVGLRSDDGRWWWDGRQWQPTRTGLQHGWQAVALAAGVAAIVLFGGVIGSGLDHVTNLLAYGHP